MWLHFSELLWSAGVAARARAVEWRRTAGFTERVSVGEDGEFWRDDGGDSHTAVLKYLMPPEPHT